MSATKTGRGALFACGVSAILASSCFLGPLVLITLGFSGAWIGDAMTTIKALTKATEDAGYPSQVVEMRQ